MSISRNKDKICKNIYDNLIRLNLDKSFLIKFVENYILNKQNIHDTSIKNQDQLIQKLEHSQLFKIKTIDTKKTIELRIDLIEKNPNAKRIFLTSLEEYLLFDKLKEYEYQQYAYNDYYWALKQQNPRDLSEENIEIDCYHDHPDDNSKQDDHEFCNHNHFDDKENHDGIAPQDVSETFTYSDAGCQDGHHDHIGCQSNNHDHAGCWDGQYDHVVEQRQRNSQDGGKCCNHSQDGQYDHVSFRSIGDDYQHADQRRNNSQDYEKYFNHTHAGSQDRHHNHVFEQRQNNSSESES